MEKVNFWLKILGLMAFYFSIATLSEHFLLGDEWVYNEDAKIR